MRFKDIKINEDGVELTRVDSLPDGTELSQKMTNSTAPLAEFSTALQAFSGYAVNLVGVPDWSEEVRISSVHLSEQPKTRKRGLIVTFTKRIERAKNRVVVINTPLMHAPAADEEGVNPGTFEREVLNMIKAVEDEATRYWNGERDQAEMFSRKESGGEKGATAEGAEGDELAKRRGKKPPRNAGTVNEVMNPDKTKAPDDAQIRKLLLAAGRDVPIDAIARVTATERDAAQRWAEAAVDPKIKPSARPKEPEWVQRDGTPALIEQVAEARGEQ